MREIITLEDKSLLFNTAKSMHDEIMTHIEVVENEIRIEYGKLVENDFWKPYKKATVTYFIDSGEGYMLSIIKVGNKKNTVKCYCDDSNRIDKLNKCKMSMFMFSINLFGEMTLYFEFWNKKKRRNAELTFTPITIQYDFEE